MESNAGTVVLMAAELGSLANWNLCSGVSPWPLTRVMRIQTSICPTMSTVCTAEVGPPPGGNLLFLAKVTTAVDVIGLRDSAR